MSPDGYTLDFDSSVPQFFLAEGWSPPERSGEMTFAWASAQESRLWVPLSPEHAVLMELRVLPFTFHGSPPQAVEIHMNGRFLAHLPLTTSE